MCQHHLEDPAFKRARTMAADKDRDAADPVEEATAA